MTKRMNQETSLTFLDSKRFKTQIKKDPENIPNIGIRKQFIPESVKTVDSDNRIIRFTISTGTVDRDFDTINPKGWSLKAFKDNPVILWAHDSFMPPIARSPKVFLEDDKLKADAEFMTADMNPFADSIYKMIIGGFLKATSVGFVPEELKIVDRGPEMEDDEDEEEPSGHILVGTVGIDFLKQELVEFSIVPVPSNPDALMEARSKGINTSYLNEWYEKALDDWAEYKNLLLVPKKSVEKLFKLSSPQKNKIYRLSNKKSYDLLMKNLQSVKDQLVAKEKEEYSQKGAISYSSAHSGGTPKADRDSDWDAGAEVKAADIDDLKVMATWKADKPNDDLVKGDFKLPHHKASGHAVVWRGVTAAMGALLGARGGVDIPSDDRKGVYNHLARHYREFDEEPPDFKQVEEQILKSEEFTISDEDGSIIKVETIETEIDEEQIEEQIEKITEEMKEELEKQTEKIEEEEDEEGCWEDDAHRDNDDEDENKENRGGGADDEDDDDDEDDEEEDDKKSVPKKPLAIKIIGDGTPTGTLIVDADTGRALTGIVGFSLAQSVGELPELELALNSSQLDMTFELDKALIKIIDMEEYDSEDEDYEDEEFMPEDYDDEFYLDELALDYEEEESSSSETESEEPIDELSVDSIAEILSVENIEEKQLSEDKSDIRKKDKQEDEQEEKSEDLDIDPQALQDILKEVINETVDEVLKEELKKLRGRVD